MLRGKVEGEMALLSEGSSVKESSEDKQASAPCVKGSAKISRRVTLALYTGIGRIWNRLKHCRFMNALWLCGKVKKNLKRRKSREVKTEKK